MTRGRSRRHRGWTQMWLDVVHRHHVGAATDVDDEVFGPRPPDPMGIAIGG
jgi:hypothetical protein